MIAITKGNPTPEEIAALVAVLALVSGTTKRITSSPAGQWRRLTPFDEANPAALSRRGRRWQSSSAGWSRVGPGYRSQLPQQRHSECKDADERCAVGAT